MATAHATAPPQATTSAEPSGPTSSNAPGRSRRRGGRGGGRGGRGGRGNGGRGNSQPAAGQDDREGANTKKKSNNTKRPARRGRRGSANEVAGDNVGANAQVTTAFADVSSQARAPPSPSTQHALDFISDSMHHGSNDSANDATTAANANEKDKNKTKNQPAKKKKAKKKGQNKNYAQESSATGQPQQQQQGNADNEQKKKKRNRRKKKTISKPWKYSIPQDAVDPISLDPLEDLPYPPFAIVVDEPYVPVLPGMWPPPRPTALLTKSSDTTDNNNDDRGIKEEKKQEEVVKQSKATTLADTTNGRDREMEILRAQWGEVAVRDEVDGDLQSKKDLAVDKIAASSSPPTTATNNLQGRNFNLFDGRVLAFYLVSTLQFIDPLNRRDLTRPELEALDVYLSHHKLGNAGVVEAYDDKGVTISTAGIAAQSATGRAEILQQEATAILSSFFQSGQHGRSTQLQTTSSQQQQSRQQLQRERRDVRRVHSLGNMNNNNNNNGGGGQQQMNTFQRMYAAQSGRGGNPSSQQQQQMNHDVGIYGGDDGGLLVIDDDINPGLRSGMPPDARGGGDAASIGTLHSARHIAERHSQAAQVREGNFPSLATATAASSASRTHNADNAAAASKKPPPPSAGKSLSKISKLVKKTNPKEAERQRKARDEAQKRAELSKLSFFDPSMPSASSTGGGVGTGPMTAPQTKAPPSEGMLERNRNLAMALGVAPSTVRSEQPSLTGWARPDFGNELNAAQYPDALLAEANERMVELLKVEKQWKRFLSDDREASCSLKPMARPLRKFIHEYSDFWRLHTESFDPEGRRYIYCAKLADTCAPYPSLSEAARKWRGPTAGPNTDTDMLLNLPTGPAPKPITTPDGWRTEQRVRLKLAPRTVTIDQYAPPASTSGMVRSTSTPFLSMTGERPPPPRFADLHNKERPRLQLTKRSIPTWDELKNRHVTQEEWNAMTPDQMMAILCEIDEEETKQAAHLKRQQDKEDAREYRLEIKAKKRAAEKVKQKTILESAFASSSDDDGDGSSGSDWFEDDLEFDGSDDEGM